MNFPCIAIEAIEIPASFHFNWIEHIQHVSVTSISQKLLLSYTTHPQHFNKQKNFWYFFSNSINWIFVVTTDKIIRIRSCHPTNLREKVKLLCFNDFRKSYSVIKKLKVTVLMINLVLRKTNDLWYFMRNHWDVSDCNGCVISKNQLYQGDAFDLFYWSIEIDGLSFQI